MSERTQDFFHQYRLMNTRILLARYRSGGLLPEAEAALLEVLADRGYGPEALESHSAAQEQRGRRKLSTSYLTFFVPEKRRKLRGLYLTPSVPAFEESP